MLRVVLLLNMVILRKGVSGEVKVTHGPPRALPRLGETDTMFQVTCQVGKLRGKVGLAPVRVPPLEKDLLNLLRRPVLHHSMAPLAVPPLLIADPFQCQI